MSDKPTSPQTELSERHLNILMSEADRMQTLYLEARSGIQSVFNFYLTFVTAVVGALVFVFQLGSSPIQLNVTLIALLLFTALVGSVYMGALSARYAYAGRYAHALDVIRRAILNATNTPTPPLYDTFMQSTPDDVTAPIWYVWLFPTGTYQMFMGFVNSMALGLIIWFTSALGDTSTGSAIFASVFTFVITLMIFNVYAHLTIVRFSRVIDVRVDLGGKLMMWSARQ